METPGQIWLTERSKANTSRLMPREIRAYVAAGGKVIQWREVLRNALGDKFTKITYVTEDYGPENLSYNLDARTVKAIINDGGLFPDGGTTEDGMVILVK
jgi:hypothetical protein